MAVGSRLAAKNAKDALNLARSFLSELTGADDPASRGAARALMRSIRKQLSKRGGTSAPGEAPRQQTGRTRRSVGTEVVGGVRRVGLARFVGRLLEEGVDSQTQETPSGRAFDPRRRQAKKARRVLKIERRPFMEQALSDALPKMDGEAVTSLQAKERTLRTF